MGMVPITQRRERKCSSLNDLKLGFVNHNLAVMRPGLDPALVVARHLDPCRASKVDKVAQKTLFLVGEQDLDIQGLALRLGLDGKGSKEIGTIDIDTDGVMQGRTDDLGSRLLLIGVQQVNLGRNLSRFRGREQPRHRILPLDPSREGILNRRNLSIEALDRHIPPHIHDRKVLDESMRDISNRQLNIRSLDRKRLKAVEVSRDGDEYLKGNRAFKLFFKGCVDSVGVLVAVLDRLEGGGVLEDRFLGLDACPDLDHVFVPAQNSDLTLFFQLEMLKHREREKRVRCLNLDQKKWFGLYGEMSEEGCGGWLSSLK